MNNCVNLVNFVRGCEPRDPNLDLFAPVKREIEINREYGFKSTFLLQYDALIRPDFQELFLKERNENTELGIWFEMGRPLVEAVGLTWRGREGYDWDWHVNTGFLEGYTPQERKLIIDEAFRLFKEIFGTYPKVAGSWLLDAYSLAYMNDTYKMDAFCICREQYAVDAYTLWGGYYSGGYYPSRNNMLCPAQHTELQINTPTFRMLGIDPIYGYGVRGITPKFKGCYTMEPCWQSGKDEAVMDWYFRSYYENESLSFSHCTTGQENSFGLNNIEKGYLVQAELIKNYVSAGKLRLETLGETGRRFKADFPETPASVLSAMCDWSDNGIKTAWYSCKNYRANLLYQNGKLYFRDIQKFDDSIKEYYLDKPCEEWQAYYYNLPVVDNFLWSNDEKTAALSFAEKITAFEFSKKISDSELEYKVTFENGQIGTVTFDEDGISFNCCGELDYSTGVGKVEYTVNGNELQLTCRENTYSVSIFAEIKQTENGLTLKPEKGKIIIKM